MITLVILALGAITGCDSFKSCDTADTGECVSGDGSAPLIQEYNYTCDGSTCVWNVLADGEIGTVELAMIETGDASMESGCTESDIGNGGLVCGVWSEYHNDFRVAELENTYGGETKEITLNIVASFEDQVSNSSTIFDVTAGNINEQITFEYTIYDSNGNYADCVKNGHDPSFFDCANRF